MRKVFGPEESNKCSLRCVTKKIVIVELWETNTMDHRKDWFRFEVLGLFFLFFCTNRRKISDIEFLSKFYMGESCKSHVLRGIQPIIAFRQKVEGIGTAVKDIYIQWRSSKGKRKPKNGNVRNTICCWESKGYSGWSQIGQPRGK